LSQIIFYGDLEKCRQWDFSSRKAKNAVFTFLHFQSLVAIENGGISVYRAGTSIFRGTLMTATLLVQRLACHPRR
jgi:hypothetical protein